MITKGKWLVMGNQRNGHFDFVLPMANDKDFQDNARLICSAPELLAACEVAVLALTHEPINPKDIEFIKDAIAKAIVN